MLAPHAVREKLVLANESATLNPPVFNQMLISRYLEKFDWLSQIKAYRQTYAERRDAMLAALAEQMPEGTTWTHPDGGFYVWVTLPEGFDAAAMLPRAVTARVAYVPGTAFYADGLGSRQLRLSYCFPTSERIVEGIRRLAGVMDERAGRDADLRHQLAAAGARAVVPVAGHRLISASAHPSPAPESRNAISCKESECMTRHVVVLAGGLSHEREVSLRSGSRLHEALRGFGGGRHPAGHRRRVDLLVGGDQAGRGDHHAARQPRRERRDPGHSRDVRGALPRDDRRQNCRLAYEKNIAKNLVQRAGFTTPRWMSLSHSTFRDLGAQTLIRLLVSHLGLPLMVKPQHGGSALGATSVRTAEDLPAALVNAFAYGEIAVVEQFVDGVELAITVLEGEDGVQALPAVEISPTSGIFDYESRYTAGLTTYFTPARLTEKVAAAAADLAIGAHRALGLRDLSRTDAIATEDGVVHFLEVNVSPGLTETSMLPMSVAEAGLDLGAVYAEMVERAISRSL